MDVSSIYHITHFDLLISLPLDLASFLRTDLSSIKTLILQLQISNSDPCTSLWIEDLMNVDLFSGPRRVICESFSASLSMKLYKSS